jgi:hypothetical protein
MGLAAATAADGFAAWGASHPRERTQSAVQATMIDRMAMSLVRYFKRLRGDDF